MKDILTSVPLFSFCKTFRYHWRLVLLWEAYDWWFEVVSKTENTLFLVFLARGSQQLSDQKNVAKV